MSLAELWCRSRLGGVLLLVTVFAVGHGCSEPSEESGLCPQPGGEFAASGCAVLAVQVLGSAGSPLSDVLVTFRALRECGCNEFGLEVDREGRFRQTIHRFQPPDSTGDTITVMVHGFATGEQKRPGRRGCLTRACSRRAALVPMGRDGTKDCAGAGPIARS